MTDRTNGSDDQPDLDDPAYDEVRRLLAGAAAASSMPSDVAAGLDETLARLVAESPTHRPVVVEAAVLPLRRRRRAGQRLLVAAAAVVLLGAGGVGITQVLDRTEQSDSTPTSATRDTAAEAPVAPVPEAAVGGGQLAATPGATAYSLQRLATTNFSAAQFPDQVSALVVEASQRSALQDDAGSPAPLTPAAPSAPAPADEPGTTGSFAGSTSDTAADNLRGLAAEQKAVASCPGPAFPSDAVALQIIFDGAPAVLVLNPVTDGTRYVVAWSCDGLRVLADATV
ncbi:MAG: hypothetical protein NTV23_01260 [Propionibacteriales bacterium]|nr:hypothetical protein [Propionibacteriales bacterium]